MAIPFYPTLQLGLPAPLRLLELWNRERPDIIHLATEGPLGWSALFAARRLGVPAVSSYHTNFHEYGRHYGLGRLRRVTFAVLRCFHNQTRATFVPTQKLRRQLESDGFLNLRILGRGVDTNLFSPVKRSASLRKSWGADDGSLVCLYVGRLAAEKNLALAVEAFQQVQRSRPDARMVWVGDGPLRKSLEKQNRRFILAGSRRGENLAEHYAAADLFLFPSQTETFGNVVIEAMASGLAVVAFRNGAAEQQIENGSSGLLAEMSDAGAFLKYAVSAASDAALRHRLGEAARRTVLRISWEEIIDRYAADLDRFTGKVSKAPFGRRPLVAPIIGPPPTRRQLHPTLWINRFGMAAQRRKPTNP